LAPDGAFEAISMIFSTMFLGTGFSEKSRTDRRVIILS
jgi:hypothetical protein